MTIIATAVKHLLAAGVTGDALVAAIAEMENAQPKDAVAEKRRAYDRERKRMLAAEGFAEERLIAFERDDWTCAYCGTRTDSPHADHVVPLSRGGSSLSSNLVTACAPCNLSKGAKTPEEWAQ